MSGRNRGLPPTAKGASLGRLPPPIHEPPFTGRGLGQIPHPVLLEEMREAKFGLVPRPLTPCPDIIHEHFAAQHQEIQDLLVDNQRLAATLVALKQEMEAAHHELQRMTHIAESMRVDKEVKMRELYDKSVCLEVDLQGAEAMRTELLRVSTDIKELTAAKQVPAIRTEIEAAKEGMQHARASIEYEKKGHVENYKHGQAMEKKLVSMARELEKLRAEMANADKCTHAAAAIGKPGAGYNPSIYGNAEAEYAAYAGNPFPPNHISHVSVENYPEYGPGPGPGTWGAYDMQSTDRLHLYSALLVFVLQLPSFWLSSKKAQA